MELPEILENIDFNQTEKVLLLKLDAKYKNRSPAQ